MNKKHKSKLSSVRDPVGSIQISIDRTSDRKSDRIQVGFSIGLEQSIDPYFLNYLYCQYIPISIYECRYMMFMYSII